jgi:hypothetical protein
LHGRTQIEGGIDDEMVRIERVHGIPDYEKGIGARRNQGCRPIEEERMNQGFRCSVGGRNGYQWEFITQDCIMDSRVYHNDTIVAGN